MAHCRPLPAVNACSPQRTHSTVPARTQPPRLQCHSRRLDAFTASSYRPARICTSRRLRTACSAASAQAESRAGKIRLIQHKEEAFWFYRFLSIVYDTVVNPGHWTEDMRTDALSVAELNNQNLKVRPDGMLHVQLTLLRPLISPVRYCFITHSLWVAAGLRCRWWYRLLHSRCGGNSQAREYYPG